MDEGALIPRMRREQLGLRMIWGRVLSSMLRISQPVGKLSQVTLNKVVFYKSTLHLRSASDCRIMAITHGIFQGITDIVYKSGRLTESKNSAQVKYLFRLLKVRI